MFFERKYYDNALQKSLKNRKICFVIGARQVGKTTLLKNFMQNFLEDTENNPVFLSCDALALKKFESAEEFLQYFMLQKNIDFTKITHLFLDEIQMVENITLFLKDLHDNYPFKIFASGSGSLQIFSGISESLIGRKEIINVYPFSFQEFLSSKQVPYIPLQKSTNTSVSAYQSYIKEFLLYGGYPEVLLQKSISQKISTLAELYRSYSEQDIRYYLAQKELSAFQKFYAHITGSIGSLFSVDSFCQKINISRKKVEEFAFLLQNTFLGIFLPPFVHNKSKELSSHSKVFFSDTGFINSIWGNFSLSPERKGLLVENFVLTELMKSKPEFLDLYFWRKKSQTEIDIIIKNAVNVTTIPLEIKSGNRDIIPRAFKSFFEAYGDTTPYGIVLTESLHKIRKYNGKKIIFIPYCYAGEIISMIEEKKL